MGDLPARSSPIGTVQLTRGKDPCVDLQLSPPQTQFSFRGDSAAAARAGLYFGVTIPMQASHSTSDGERAALWLGPDEWLLLAPPSQEDAIANDFTLALAGLAHSLVRISHRQTAIRLNGPAAARLLNCGCPLDLDPEIFPVGGCTRSIFAKAQIVVWRRDRSDFTIFVWRSFVPYVWDFLIDARQRL